MSRILGRQSGTLDMTQGAIWSVLVTFTVPLLLGNLFQLLYNTVDSIVVGNFVGRTALAAVSATTQICNTLVKFFTGTSIGAGAVISRRFGAKDRVQLHQAIHTTMALTAWCCVLLTALGLLCANWMLERMSTPAEVFAEASLYLRIYFAGISGLLIYNMGGSILRAIGDTRRPLFFLLACSGMNVALDLVFVLCFHWGIAGVAAATVLSQFVSAGLVLWCLTFSVQACPFSWRQMRIHPPTARQILKLGLPVGLQQAVISFSNVFIQAYINAFDTACIAGWGCYIKLEQYMMLPIQSMGQAVTTFTGQNLGGKRLDRAKQGVWIALLLTLGISAVTAAVLCGFAPALSGLFTPDQETIRYSALFIRMCTPVAILCCFNQIFSGALRGAGKSQIPMAVTLCTHVLFRQIYLLFVSRLLPGNVYAIGSGYPAGWALCAAAISVYYRFSKWDVGFAQNEAPK